MSIQNYELSLSKYLRLIFRNKIFIFSATFLSTLFFIIYSYTVKTIWKGSFQIIVDGKENVQSGSSLIRSIGIESVTGLTGLGPDTNKTQEYILKSPSVLYPVYEFFKKEKLSAGEVIDISYNRWLENKLQIEFEKGTSVLIVSFVDSDKDLIISILKMISDSYKEYSKKEKDNSLDNAIKYTTLQLDDLRENYSRSLKKLNKFSIENGLGDVDGFVDLDLSSSNLNPSNLNSLSQIQGLNKNLEKRLIDNSSSSAAQRYNMQFKLLERYEAEYVSLKSKLKDNSKLMISLKNKIDNLKSNLKRPNQILLEFRNLKRIASRDSNFLKDVEYNLQFLTLEKIKQDNPWKIIYEPTISDAKVSPVRREIAIFSFLLSFIGATLIVIIKEIKDGTIYEFEELREKIRFPYLDTIYKGVVDVNNQLIKGIIEEKNIKIKGKLGFINLIDNFFDSDPKYHNEHVNDKKFEEINVNNKDQLENIESIIIFAQSGQIKEKNLLLINSILKIYEKKIIGWVYINSEIKF